MTNPRNYSVFDDQERIEAPEAERADIVKRNAAFCAAIERAHPKLAQRVVTEPGTENPRKISAAYVGRSRDGYDYPRSA